MVPVAVNTLNVCGHRFGHVAFSRAPASSIQIVALVPATSDPLPAPAPLFSSLLSQAPSLVAFISVTLIAAFTFPISPRFSFVVSGFGPKSVAVLKRRAILRNSLWKQSKSFVAFYPLLPLCFCTFTTVIFTLCGARLPVIKYDLLRRNP